MSSEQRQFENNAEFVGTAEIVHYCLSVDVMSRRDNVATRQCRDATIHSFIHLLKTKGPKGHEYRWTKWTRQWTWTFVVRLYYAINTGAFHNNVLVIINTCRCSLFYHYCDGHWHGVIPVGLTAPWCSGAWPSFGCGLLVLNIVYNWRRLVWASYAVT